MAVGVKVRQLVECEGNHLVGGDSICAADKDGEWEPKMVGVCINEGTVLELGKRLMTPWLWW